ncbi:MAG: rRNA maturation RNase YbeY [Patescibacteria group bacterium]
MIKIEINQQVGKKISEVWLNKIVKGTFGAVGAKNAEISVAFVGDQEMEKLNKVWRGKNKTTDVLSFTYEKYKRGSKKPLIGEIIISYPRAARQAKEREASTTEEIKMLLIHGALHLAGYNHEKNFRQAREMEKLQNKMVKLLNS